MYVQNAWDDDLLARGAAEVAEVLELKPEQVEIVFKDIEAKRRTTKYLHMGPILVEPLHS